MTFWSILDKYNALVRVYTALRGKKGGYFNFKSFSLTILWVIFGNCPTYTLYKNKAICKNLGKLDNNKNMCSDY